MCGVCQPRCKCFNGAATSLLRNDELLCRFYNRFISFNGAATSLLRNGLVGLGVALGAASFNGAATSLLRNVLYALYRYSQILSFNGAATSLLRNETSIETHINKRTASMGPQHHCCGMLMNFSTSVQWSLSASMGPQHHCCGMSNTSLRVRRRPHRFNGAATSLLRNAVEIAVALQLGTASMGPQHHCCGMTETAIQEIPVVLLQWGRNITAAEC